MRRRLRGSGVGRALRRDPRACTPSARPGGPPRCRRDRQLGRRCGPPHADSLPAVLPRRSQPRAAARGRPAVRGRGLLPPHGARRAGTRHRDHRRGAARGGSPHPRMARRPHRRRGARRQRAGHLSHHPAGDHRRPRRRAHRCGRVGARAVRRPPHDRAAHRRCGSRAAAVLRVLALVPNARLQGAAHGHAASGVLPRLEVAGLRNGDRGVPSALLDQHQPELASGPTVPSARPQRRNQYAVGQSQRDACPRAGARVACMGRDDRLPQARDLGRGQRFDEPRQRGRAAGALRPRPGARAHDARPRGPFRRDRDGAGAARVLRVPRVPGRAVGRPRRARVLGRGDRGLRPGP